MFKQKTQTCAPMTFRLRIRFEMLVVLFSVLMEKAVPVKRLLFLIINAAFSILKIHALFLSADSAAPYFFHILEW